MFGPESIGKHITQLVANWVFPRESVFGPESIGKHITQLVANWVFPRESVFGPESIGNTHNGTNCELGFSKRNRIHCRRFA